ncbi:MAG: hypothetical protein C0483_12180 [Pirellula sp.]|nr:hypothetical protein [Pirellula sp.]
MRRTLLVATMLLSLGAPLAAAEPFELKDGDRVVFLGNTLIEREQKYGYWELMLTIAWPERNVTFRNLGWSGDTVWGESRAGFGTQADGFKALREQVAEAKPTVIFIGYGNVEAFAGEKGLPKFVEGLNQLLDVLEPTKASIVVLGPTLQNGAESPNPNWKQYNDDVRSYSRAMSAAADKRGHRFVDLIAVTEETSFQSKEVLPMTEDGATIAELGYLVLFDAVADQLQLPDEIEARSEKLFPDDDSSPPLLTAILKKNELFFHRWRPQNETYLFGFRKHEQGNNAKEVFEFDPLIVAEEKKIAELRAKLVAESKKADGAK